MLGFKLLDASKKVLECVRTRILARKIVVSAVLTYCDFPSGRHF